MPTQLFANNAVSLLAAPLSTGGSTIQLMAGYGALFPTPGADEYFLLTLENEAASLREIVRISGRSGDTLTIAARAQEGTFAQNWPAGTPEDTLVDLRVTAETMRQAMLLPTSGGTGGTAETVDSSFTLFTGASTSTLTLPTNFVTNSVKVYVGGLRQKRGIDFTESAANQLTLQFVLTQTEIDNGVNVVVDYTPA